MILKTLPYDSLAFRKRGLRDLPGFVLLESGDTTRGRYDILSAMPYKTLTFFEEEADNVFSELEAHLPLKRSPMLDFLPFQGGAIGYFSYDLAGCLQGIPLKKSVTEKRLPLAIFGLYDVAIVVDHNIQKVFLFGVNQKKKTKEALNELEKAWMKEKDSFSSFEITSTVKSFISKKEAKISFDNMMKALLKGRTYQTNYTMPFELNYCGDAFSIYETITKKNPVPYASFLNLHQEAILSFSPERFVLFDDGHLLTSPIKGTMKRDKDKMKDQENALMLEKSLKNRAENVMIVDLMRNDLGKIAKPGSVKVTALCKVESFPRVHHLVSDIEAICRDDITPMKAFSACFPGGSITGAPKIEAMKLIAEEEKFSRGVYCGCIGYFSLHGRFDTNIAIRTMIAENSRLTFNAGGALLLDSTFEEEYEECLVKVDSFLNGLFTDPRP